MLSRLLRRLLLSQLVGGALLGWFLVRLTGGSPWLVVVAGVGFPCLIYAVVVLMTAIESRAPGAGWPWWRSLAGEYRASLQVFMFQQPWTQAAPGVLPALGAVPAVPVVLVHGFVCNHRIWDAMSTALRRAGHPVLSIDLEPLFTSIDDYAPLIEQAVTQLCRQTGAPQVALVGHSMGGLAIRAWMRVHGSARVVRVITLGTPHAGTQVSVPLPCINTTQMSWRSAWLQQLAASESAATRSLMRIALTTQDNIVYPQREQVLEGVPVTVFGGLGHLELCGNTAVAAWVVQQLDPLARSDAPR